MALHRLQLLAAARGVFAPEQCGVRPGRAAADCLAAVVSTLERALHDGEMAILLLLDVQSAFDSLPHASTISAVRALGVEGRLLNYLQAFLTDRTFCVRVGRATSSPRSVHSGVPQGSVLSPFLFKLVLAPVVKCLPETADLPVRVVIYADDVALNVRGPTRKCSAVRERIQTALERVAAFLEGIGLALSPKKTEALVVHLRAAPRRHLSCLQLHGAPIGWQSCVRYLLLTIDNRLRWLPAVKRIHQAARRVETCVRRLLARGDGCPPLMLETSTSSRVAETLAEARVWPVSLTSDMRALCHVERHNRARDAGPLLTRRRAVPNSCVGRILDIYHSVVVDEPTPPARWPAPHYREPLPVSLELPGVRCKRNTPRCAIAQEASARMHKDLAGRIHVFSDGSVLQDRSAAGACVAPELGTELQRRLSYCASSTTAELVDLQLAADLLRDSAAVTSAVIFCDSKPALRQLAREDSGAPLAQLVAQSLLALRESGCDVVLQWLPSHVGIAGNEAADELAKQCPALDYAQKRLVSVYRLVGLPCASLQDFLHPNALVHFLEDANLIERVF
ncbi:uncharacterized protein LOC119376648 [Rhipicephalus sanguineus]|uniref:uncharacterized protein LOC119376648 n=1 Tax=Rhipicephalus sanguineus TaxID=34632 RepID=UPI0018941AB1|nr:uncharacterized protein LOC119376648 [Rhipicephalus sanguineus]